MTIATASPSKDIKPGTDGVPVPARVVREVVADSRVLGREFSDDRRGVVRAGVVDHHDLVVDAGALESWAIRRRDRDRSRPRYARG